MLEAFSAYPSFQILLGFVISMVLTMAIMPFWIKFLTRKHIGQQVRDDGPETHLVKQGTPTMGGLVILAVLAVAALFCGGTRPEILAVLVATLLTGVIGFVDDYAKVAHNQSLGLTPTQKMIGLTVIAVAFCLFAVNFLGVPATVTIPLVNFDLDLGIFTTIICGFKIPWLYLAFVFLLMVGMSNSTNLTDGLDGLAAGSVTFAMFAMTAICFVSDNLGLGIASTATAGALVGFLWYNAYPAKIFMGDTGSLALGTMLTAIAVVTKTEVISLVIGGLFVVEALSVMIQVAYFKKTHKRIFLMAPLHHHFEKKWQSEVTVVVRFWIVSALLASIGFCIFFIEIM